MATMVQHVIMVSETSLYRVSAKKPEYFFELYKIEFN
jgi:hypothetical protein